MKHPIRALLALAAMLCAGSAIAFATPATAVSAWPSAPSGVKVVTITHTTLTITASKGSNVTAYRVYGSPIIGDLWAASLKVSHSTRSVAASTTSPTLTLKSLTYRTGLYYYRYQTLHGSNVLMSNIYSTYLRPDVPSGVTVTSTTSGLHLNWSGGVGTSTVIVQSTNTAMTEGRVVYTVRGLTNQFTPQGMTAGTRYYFNVKASNGNVSSSYAPELAATFQASQQPLRFMTYNILTLVSDGTVESGGGRIAPWSERKVVAAALIKQAMPDVLAVQEGGAHTTSDWLSPRQVDSLVSQLGGDYRVASTEALAGQPGYTLTGNYIVYRSTIWEAVGTGGHYYLAGEGSAYSAAYQLLRNKTSGVEVLAVSTHMSSGSTAADCAQRASETTALINGAEPIASAAGGVPILWAGDFASAPASWLPDDSPGRLMRTSALANDSYFAARSWTNDTYNSFNGYQSVVPTGGLLIDRIFGTAGIAMEDWHQLINQSGGKFVGVIPSDHNPVYADLIVQGASAAG